jgi:hypothetical protein
MRQKQYIQELEKRVNVLTTETAEAKSKVELLQSENKLIKEQLVYLRRFIQQAISLSFPFTNLNRTSAAANALNPPSLNNANALNPTPLNNTALNAPTLSNTAPTSLNAPTLNNTAPTALNASTLNNTAPRVSSSTPATALSAILNNPTPQLSSTPATLPSSSSTELPQNDPPKQQDS